MPDITATESNINNLRYKDILKEVMELLVRCSKIDDSGQCEKMVERIDNLIGNIKK